MRKRKLKIAVMGDPGSVTAFRGLGLEVHPVSTETDVQSELRALIRTEAFAVIFLTEPVFQGCGSVIAEHRYDYLPAIVSIPSAGENQGIALRSTQEAVRRAVGFDILRNRDDREPTDEGE